MKSIEIIKIQKAILEALKQNYVTQLPETMSHKAQLQYRRLLVIITTKIETLEWVLED